MESGPKQNAELNTSAQRSAGEGPALLLNSVGLTLREPGPAV